MKKLGNIREMDRKIIKDAENDINSLDEAIWEEIKDKINSLDPKLNHKDLKIIDNPILDKTIWQLTVTEGSSNHRVFLDIDKSRLVVLAIWSFDFTHKGDKHWKELSERI